MHVFQVAVKVSQFTRRLKALNISQCNLIGDASVAALSLNCPVLKELRAWGCLGVCTNAHVTPTNQFTHADTAGFFTGGGAPSTALCAPSTARYTGYSCRGGRWRPASAVHPKRKSHAKGTFAAKDLQHTSDICFQIHGKVWTVQILDKLVGVYTPTCTPLRSERQTIKGSHYPQLL
jgi:hypothetical protein